MGKYTVIADVSEELSKILGEALVPDLIPDKNAIGFCSPEEKGDFLVGIHLYDMRKDGELGMSGMVNRGLRAQKYPPLTLSLYFMITAYSKSDLKFKSLEEFKVLGRMTQALTDHSVLPSQVVGNDIYQSDARIELLDLDLEDKLRIWNDSKQYKPSIFCRITPIELESTKSKTITRVKEFTLEVEEKRRD